MNNPSTKTLDNPLCNRHRPHTVCLDVLLHQLAAINTSPLSTCVLSSGIWVALSEVCSCIIRISTATLKVIPAGSCLSQEGLSQSLSQLQHAVFSCIIKNVMQNLSIQSPNKPSCSLKATYTYQSNIFSLT